MLIFDTSDYVRKLQKAAFTEQQAEVQVDALRTLIENDLATKQDIARLQKDIAKLRKETQESIESLRKEVKQNIELLSKETQLGRARITAELVKDIAEAKVEAWKWIIAGILLTQVGLVVPLMKLL
jgi:molecular chaperone GrpE (heat shock protein)